MTKRLATLILLLQAFAASVYAQEAPGIPADVDIRRLLAERIDDQKRSVGIVVGVVGPEERRVVGYGRLTADDPREPGGDTVFEIGSITKVFTAILLAGLAEEGAVELETPVQGLLGPDVTMPTRNGAEITLLHLATHSSGLPRLPSNLQPSNAANPYADYTVSQLHEFLSSHELVRDIGEAVEYSNLGGGLLGHVLALSQETDYETLVSARLLEPLGMSDTSITLSPSQQERLAIGHSVQLRPVANWDLPTLAGAGALRSTVNDLLTFVEANLGLGESSLHAAMAVTHAPRRDFAPPDMRIGLGWITRKRTWPRTPLAQRRHRRVPVLPGLRPRIADRRRRAVELRGRRRRPGLPPSWTRATGSLCLRHYGPRSRSIRRSTTPTSAGISSPRTLSSRLHGRGIGSSFSSPGNRSSRCSPNRRRSSSCASWTRRSRLGTLMTAPWTTWYCTKVESISGLGGWRKGPTESRL